MKNAQVFGFKQFVVDQTGCVMKINTDGVLLGAMATHPSPNKILDIGTGTGVIALMLAQRFKGAFIQAVEIDQEASTTAARNFGASVFSKRLTVKNIAIAEFETDEKFDLIVSNPPFFVNDLKNVDKRKGIARHANEDFFKQLMEKVAELLSKNGLFWAILPVKQAEMLIELGLKENLFVSQKVKICSDESKTAVRNILCFGKNESEISESNFYIYESLNAHTKEYRLLLKEFFIAF